MDRTEGWGSGGREVRAAIGESKKDDGECEKKRVEGGEREKAGLK